MAADTIFRAADGGAFSPTEHAAGPWDPGALHGGAAAALIVRSLQEVDAPAPLAVARLSFELLRPIPSADLKVSTRVVRDGRRVQELAAELHAGEDLICRAGALRVSPVGDGLPAGEASSADAAEVPAMPGPEAGEPFVFTLDNAPRESFGASMDMRFLDPPFAEAPTRVWMRMRHPLVDGERPSPLASLAATADFGNGVGAALPFDGFLFINADLHVHLWREPRGEWIGLDARTILLPGGSGTATSVLHDADGPVGRAFQSLVVGRR
jgi:hypothetical protein